MLLWLQKQLLHSCDVGESQRANHCLLEAVSAWGIYPSPAPPAVFSAAGIYFLAAFLFTQSLSEMTFACLLVYLIRALNDKLAGRKQIWLRTGGTAMSVSECADVLAAPQRCRAAKGDGRRGWRDRRLGAGTRKNSLIRCMNLATGCCGNAECATKSFRDKWEAGNLPANGQE